MNASHKLKTRIRIWLVFFMAAIALSGITAVPVEWEIGLLIQADIFPESLVNWLTEILNAIQFVGREYPFILYGNDWLAFGHIVIALAFIGPFQDPVRNKWIVDWAMLACMLVIPVAFLAGAYRDIPIFWRLIDCSFGVMGILPLIHVRRLINRLEKSMNPVYV